MVIPISLNPNLTRPRSCLPALVASTRPPLFTQIEESVTNVLRSEPSPHLIMQGRKCDICAGVANHFGKFAVCDACRDKAIADAVARSMARKSANSSVNARYNSTGGL